MYYNAGVVAVCKFKSRRIGSRCHRIGSLWRMWRIMTLKQESRRRLPPTQEDSLRQNLLARADSMPRHQLKQVVIFPFRLENPFIKQPSVGGLEIALLR
jgi:hypothetical protein